MTSIRTMPIRTLLTIVGILATMLMVLLTAPDSALAANNAPGGPSKTQKELIKEGYTCEGMGSYGSVCTKGDSTYYCDRSGKCESARNPTGKPTGGRPGSGPPHAGGNSGIAPVGVAPPAHKSPPPPRGKTPSGRGE